MKRQNVILKLVTKVLSRPREVIDKLGTIISISFIIYLKYTVKTLQKMNKRNELFIARDVIELAPRFLFKSSKVICISKWVIYVAVHAESIAINTEIRSTFINEKCASHSREIM